MEHNHLAAGFEALHDDRRARKGRVAAKRHLDHRGEPANSVVATIGNQKGGFGKVVFGRNSLQHFLRRKPVQHHDGSRIPAEPAAGESIDLENGRTHSARISTLEKGCNGCCDSDQRTLRISVCKTL